MRASRSEAAAQPRHSAGGIYAHLSSQTRIQMLPGVKRLGCRSGSKAELARFLHFFSVLVHVAQEDLQRHANAVVGTKQDCDRIANLAFRHSADETLDFGLFGALPCFVLGCFVSFANRICVCAAMSQHCKSAVTLLLNSAKVK